MYRAKGQGKNSFWIAETVDLGGMENLPRQ